MILGISLDTVDENRAFAEKFDFPFLLLCDTDKKVALAYGAIDDPGAKYASRISYVIDGDGKISAVFGKVDVKTHATDVLGKL